jgi:ribose 5-phosphate isomerase RpiB
MSTRSETGQQQALEVVQEFLDGEYAGGRHQARIDKIATINKGNNERSGKT